MHKAIKKGARLIWGGKHPVSSVSECACELPWTGAGAGLGSALPWFPSVPWAMFGLECTPSLGASSPLSGIGLGWVPSPSSFGFILHLRLC